MYSFRTGKHTAGGTDVFAAAVAAGDGCGEMKA